jgi:hypothetical protein
VLPPYPPAAERETPVPLTVDVPPSPPSLADPPETPPAPTLISTLVSFVRVEFNVSKTPPPPPPPELVPLPVTPFPPPPPPPPPTAKISTVALAGIVKVYVQVTSVKVITFDV